MKATNKLPGILNFIHLESIIFFVCVSMFVNVVMSVFIVNNKKQAWNIASIAEC